MIQGRVRSMFELCMVVVRLRQLYLIGGFPNGLQRFSAAVNHHMRAQDLLTLHENPGPLQNEVLNALKIERLRQETYINKIEFLETQLQKIKTICKDPDSSSSSSDVSAGKDCIAQDVNPQVEGRVNVANYQQQITEIQAMIHNMKQTEKLYVFDDDDAVVLF